MPYKDSGKRRECSRRSKQKSRSKTIKKKSSDEFQLIDIPPYFQRSLLEIYRHEMTQVHQYVGDIHEKALGMFRSWIQGYAKQIIDTSLRSHLTNFNVVIYDTVDDLEDDSMLMMYKSGNHSYYFYMDDELSQRLHTMIPHSELKCIYDYMTDKRAFRRKEYCRQIAQTKVSILKYLLSVGVETYRSTKKMGEIPDGNIIYKHKLSRTIFNLPPDDIIVNNLPQYVLDDHVKQLEVLYPLPNGLYHKCPYIADVSISGHTRSIGTMTDITDMNVTTIDTATDLLGDQSVECLCTVSTMTNDVIITTIENDVKWESKQNTTDEDGKVGYIYLIREREFYLRNDPVYKIGRTSQDPQNFIYRLKNYKKGSEIILVIECSPEDTYIKEKLLKGIFKRHFETHLDGHEHFIGDVHQMKSIIMREMDSSQTINWKYTIN